MLKLLRGAGLIVLSTIALLLSLEILLHVLGFPTGANSYVEKIALTQQLPARKPSDEFRIFTYGESTMHGSHYHSFSNPARWMEAYLKDFLPGTKIRVVNFARMGQGSDFVYRSFKNTTVYKPNLVIFYVGHNMFLPGNRVKEVHAKEDPFSFQVKLWSRQSVLISSALRLGIQMKMKRGAKELEEDQVGSEKIESGPSGIGPENKIVRDSPYYKENIAHHGANYERILDLAAQKQLPIIFFKPASNLKDFPPSCSTLRRLLKPEQEITWKKAFEEGQIAQTIGDATAALKAYEQAFVIDPTHADLLYQMGQLHFKNGNLKAAKELFEEARNEDCIQVRATQEVQTIIEGFGKSGKAILIDTEKLLVSEAPGGILGDPVVEDNVHFSVKGHSILGRALAQEIAKQGWIVPLSEWQFDNERPFEEMARGLGVTQELIFSAYLKVVSYFGSKYESRIRYAQKALEIYPDDPQALRHLAWSYWLKGDQSRAKEVYKKLSTLAPDQMEQVFLNQPELRKAFSSEIASLRSQ